MQLLKEIRQAGLRDGYEAGVNSGTTGAPADGWDGSLINAIGVTGVCKLFGLTRRGTKAWDRALAGYRRGCEAGVEAGVRDRRLVESQHA